MREPNWSLQKLGRGGGGGSSPRIVRATAEPWREAASQCSVRACSPRRGSKARATSPAAKTSGIAVRPAASVGTPPSHSSPLPASQPEVGATPIPDHHRVAAEALAAGEHELLDAAVPERPLETRAEAELHALGLGASRRATGRPRRRGCGQAGPEAPRRRHLDAERASGRRHLKADEAGTDDDDPAARPQLVAKAAGVGERAQHMDVAEVVEAPAGGAARSRWRSGDCRRGASCRRRARACGRPGRGRSPADRGAARHRSPRTRRGPAGTLMRYPTSPASSPFESGGRS